jgi:hypothetical protein
MFRTEVQDVVSKQRSFISFFPDDTIENVKQQIAISSDSHPDRMFVLVGIRRNTRYYQDDPRNWEALFRRLSFGTDFIQRPAFSVYQTQYRSPATSIEFSNYSLEEWMAVPDAMKPVFQPDSAFTEYYIFGTEEAKSYVLPFEYDSALTNKIPAAVYPIPQIKSLMSTLYPSLSEISGFLYKNYDDSAELVQSVYFPFLRSTTPDRLPDETIQLINKNSKKLQDILELPTPEPTTLTILRTRFYVPFVETEFGSAIRTRFEQMFFGLTVSKDVPYIGLFTSNTETMRHKFFVEDENNKVAWLDTKLWNAWFTKSRPARNRPTLLLYRGTSAQNFDRIAITSTDMILSTYRSEGNKDTIDELKESIQSWMVSLDSILPFINPKDIVPPRWQLQDMSLVAKYKKKVNEFDLRRFNCVSFLYDISDANSSTFRLLRTDHSVDGLTSLEVKVLQLMRQRPTLTVQNVQEELDVSAETARKLLGDMEIRSNEDPSILEKSFRGFPTMQVGVDTILIQSINRIDLPVQYANVLRYILSEPDSSELNAICPRRMEKVPIETAIAPVQNVEVDKALVDEYSDLFGYLEEEEEAAPPAAAEQSTEEQPRKIQARQSRNTLYNYFNSRLQAFDSNTFDPTDSLYPKKCEQKHQPIILSEEDLERLSTTPYDPRNYLEENRMLPVEDPNGITICPEYWCTTDEIPLREQDLIVDGASKKCPVCKGKVKVNKNDDPREFTVIGRDKAYGYPGITKHKSPKNDRVMPCCYKTPETKKVKDIEEKYYILGETKGIPPLRSATIPSDILESLKIRESYELFGEKNRRIQKGFSGFFRVGLGRPSENLRTLLGVKANLPRPSESVESVLKCSFLSTWVKKSDSNLLKIKDKLKELELPEELAKIIAGIDDAYEKKELPIMHELEYCCIVLQCDVFRVFMDKKTLGCVFYSPIAKARTRGIIALQVGQTVDILAHVSRVANSLVFKSNVFAEPFKSDTAEELQKLRNNACGTKVPSYLDAVGAYEEIAEQIDNEDYSLILDPLGRAQALYVPGKLILPFRPSPVPFDKPTLVSGYSDVELPDYYQMREFLEIAEGYSEGYAWKEDVSNIDGVRTEIVLKSGLRVPTEPDEDEEVPNGEVVQTVQEATENKVVFGEPDEELKRNYTDISYASEVFDFLMFELSKDLVEKNPDLRNILSASQPSRAKVEPLLKRWFDNVTKFVDIRTSNTFVSKVRKPCGQFKTKSSCDGNVCGWDGNVCKIQVKKSIKKEHIFTRLLTTLIENAKLRGMVLDGRSTPFFSTILYVELPHELIVTDNELRI